MADIVTTMTRANRLNMQLSGLLAALDVDIIGKETAKILAHIKQSSSDVRLDIRDWEMSDSRKEMTTNAQIARNRMTELRNLILRASEHGIFNAVDVVDLTSQLDTIEAELA